MAEQTTGGGLMPARATRIATSDGHRRLAPIVQARCWVAGSGDTPARAARLRLPDRMSGGVSIAFRVAALVLLSWLLSSPLASDGGEFDVLPSYLDLTLDEAIGLALQNNRGLLDARLERTVQAFSLEVAEDQYRPTASIGPSVRLESDEDFIAESSIEAGLRVDTGGEFTLSWSRPLTGRKDASDTVSLNFSQPLLRGFGTGVETASLRSARFAEEFNILVFREAIAGVVDATIRAWYGLARAQRQLEIGEASLERARKQLETNRTLIEAGRMAEREILQSEADVAERELGLVQTRNSVTAANFRLINILDIDSATVIRPADRPAAPRAILTLEEAIETAFRHSPGYAQALLSKEIAQIALEVAENDQLWDLRFEADVSRGTDRGAEGTDYSAGMKLTIPLWDRTPELGLANARAGVTLAERALAEFRQAIDIQVRQAVHDVEVGLRRIELARQALALSEEKLEIERSKVRQGLSSIFQLSRFEDDLVQAQNAEVDALIDYENALAALDRTLGTTLQTWDIRVEQVGR